MGLFVRAILLGETAAVEKAESGHETVELGYVPSASLSFMTEGTEIEKLKMHRLKFIVAAV